jgi:CheY-like chemotaxis protein
VPAALAARPDVAVVDIELPGQDGIGAAAALRQPLPGCRALMLTMYRRGERYRLLRSAVAVFDRKILAETPTLDTSRRARGPSWHDRRVEALEFDAGRGRSSSLRLAVVLLGLPYQGF